MVLREAANGFKRMGNLFEDEQGNTRLYIQTNGSYESFEIAPESVHLYEYLDESPSSGLLGAEEAAEELWDDYSELINDDVSSLETVAGNCIIREHKFKKAIIAHSAQYRDECDRLRGLLENQYINWWRDNGTERLSESLQQFKTDNNL